MKIATGKWKASLFIAALAMPLGIPAQNHETQRLKPNHHTYKLIDLGTFGGPNSHISNPSSIDLNNRGVIQGWADFPIADPFAPNCFDDCFVAHAFVRQNGVVTDLGALPGGSSSASVWINEQGTIVGSSENGLVDPLTGFPDEAPVLWQDGQIIELESFGGAQGGAAAINDRGQIVGSGLNIIPDPYSSDISQTYLAAPAATQSRAALWVKGQLQDIGTLGGNDAAAFLINNRGQVAGVSYTNTTPNSATNDPTLDPFLWENGKMEDLGTLGGAWGNPTWINSRGQVVGQSDIAGDQFFHPFLWEREMGMLDLGTLGGNTGSANWANDAGEVVGYADLPGTGAQLHHGFFWKGGTMVDLGTVDGDVCSNALSINSSGQVVGASTSCHGFVHGFLWENGGPMVDLNSLIVPASSLRVMEGDDINDRGEIAGKAVLPNGDVHAVLLIPSGECEEQCEARIATNEKGARANAETLASAQATTNDAEIRGARRFTQSIS